MPKSKEFFVDLQEKYEKVKKLIEEDSKLDPPTEPYKSKYAAREILKLMKQNLENYKVNADDDSEIADLINQMLGTVWLHLGIISMGVEELALAEKELSIALKLVENQKLNPKYVLIVLNTLNQLGIYWSCNNFEKSRDFLVESQQIYLDFKEKSEFPLSFLDIFNASGDRDPQKALKNLESTHTLTLYYLAQVYGALKLTLKAAVFCHVTLKREIEFDEYEAIDWALNSATLAQVLMEQNGFKQARHHLSAASYILAQYEKNLDQNEGVSEENDAKIENFKHRSADIARCWAKYGLNLLMTSKDRLLVKTEEEENEINFLSTDLSKMDISTDCQVSKNDLSNLTFNLDLDNFEKLITDEYILTFEDARTVFLMTQNWLNEASNFYTLENHATDHIQIIQDMSQLYNYLAFFEDDPERQAKMHKRRIDHLEKVLKELNPTFYMHNCRQIWFELAETYNTILDIKMDKLKESKGVPTAHILQKVNILIEKSIENFEKFLDSLKAPTTNQMPETIPEEYEKASLKAYFQIGVLYGKFITPDKKLQLSNTEKSLDFFTKMVSYTEKNEKAQNFIPVELSVCKEMVQLLPFKVQKIKNMIPNE